MQTIRMVLLAAIAMCSTLETSAAAQKPRPTADYHKSIAKLERAVREELTAHRLHGLSLALVDDQQVVYSAAFGNVQRDSIFRAARSRNSSTLWR